MTSRRIAGPPSETPARLAFFAPAGAAILLAAVFPLLGATSPEGGGDAGQPAARPPASAPAPPPSSAPKGIAPFEVAENTKLGIWFGRFGITNCSWIDMGDGIAVIDTGASDGDAANLVAQIGEKAKGKTIRWVILTHLHGDSNSGLPALLGPDVTLFVHARSAEGAAAALPSLVKSARKPAVVGVSGRTVIGSSTRRLELYPSAGSAHTEEDLVVFMPEGATAWVGDLVTPGRCPMTSDPRCDPAGWLASLDTIDGLHPAALIPTRGDASLDPVKDVQATREYLRRLQKLLGEFKAKGFPEARVGSELSIRKLGEYCPAKLDNINALNLYRRIGADGKIAPAAEPAAAPLAPKK